MRPSMVTGSDLHKAPSGELTAPQTEETATILVADDEIVSRTALALKLERRGYRILQAQNGQEALEIAKRDMPDLIVSDVVMPVMDGLTFCATVKNDPALRVMYFILLTGHDSQEQTIEGFTRGANDFVGKAAPTTEILARVEAGLRTRMMMRQVEHAHQDLARSHALLQRKQEEIEEDLAAASQFIKSLLPQATYPAPGLRMAWEYRPSFALGGDLFGVIPWHDDCLGLYLVDASGHGASAALRVASLATFLRTDALPQQVDPRDPGAILTLLNRLFPLNEDGYYFTLWMGSLDLKIRQLRFSTAGHAGAFVVQPNTLAIPLYQPALPVGFAADTHYTSQDLSLGQGDRLILASDGLYEALGPDGERWGLPRLTQAVQERIHHPLADVVREVVNQAWEWQPQARFEDDVALVGLEFE